MEGAHIKKQGCVFGLVVYVFFCFLDGCNSELDTFRNKYVPRNWPQYLRKDQETRNWHSRS